MLTVVVGLPGSGKSMLILIEALKVPGLLILDDCLGGGARGSGRIVNLARSGRRAMIADLLLCDSLHRAGLESILPLGPGDDTRWLFFENAPGRCRQNVERRYLGDLARNLLGAEERRRRSLAWIDELAPNYQPPVGAETLAVFDYLGQG